MPRSASGFTGCCRASVPDDFSRRWVLEEFGRHEERCRWREIRQGPGGLVQAADGALVLMAHLRSPAHVGVWLRPEQRIIHCDGKTGVACEAPLALRTNRLLNAGLQIATLWQQGLRNR